MANPRVQRTLRTKVEELSKEFEVQPSIGFSIFCLQAIYGLDDFEAEEAVTDGGNDKGIDAIFTYTDETGKFVLAIVQSKFFGNPDNELDEPAKSLMVETITNYVVGDAPTDVLNAKLRPRIERARQQWQSGEIDKVRILFITNGKRPKDSIYDDLERFCRTQSQVDFQILTEQEMAELVAPASTRPTGKLSLRVSKDVGAGDRTFLSLPDIDQSNGKVVKVDVYEIAQLVKENPNIFNANVRGYLGKNKINDAILYTLSDKERITTFIYLNNGITILCDSYQIKPGNLVIELTNPSIINGCQTANTILEAFDRNKIEPNTGLVLVRVIESTSPDLKVAIIEASNNQSLVKERDIISEDEIQKELESQFQVMGYRYQRKRGLGLGYTKEDREKIVDLERAAQAYMALFLERPAEAKNKKAEIYDDYYREIFHPQINAVSLLIGYRLLEAFTLKIKQGKKSYSQDTIGLYGNALLHLVPLFNHWVLKPENIVIRDISSEKSFGDIDRLFEKKANFVLEKLTSIMAKIKSESDFKNYQYFFKSSTSFTRLLTAPGGDVSYQIELKKDNYKSHDDLRYTKPQEFSLDGVGYSRGDTWQELFVYLMNQYSDKKPLKEGNIDFIESGSRQLLLANPNEEEKKLRKKLSSGLWLLTNFDSKRLCHFSFVIAEKLGFPLAIKIRPTKYRVENKLT